jgi:hypothetical protein
VSAHLSAGPASRDQPTRVQAQAAACLAAWASPATGRPGRRHGLAWQRGTQRSPLPVFRILRHLSQVTACPRRRRRVATAPLGRRRRTRVSPRFGALGVGSRCGGLRVCGVTHITDRGRRVGLRPLCPTTAACEEEGQHCGGAGSIRRRRGLRRRIRTRGRERRQSSTRSESSRWESGAPSPESEWRALSDRDHEAHF